jgi:hypothetical protein
MMQHDKFGIYLNVKEGKAMRITSPYWIPSGDEWALLTPEVDATLLKIRELARGKGVFSDPDKITWGDWSQVPPRD